MRRALLGLALALSARAADPETAIRATLVQPWLTAARSRGTATVTAFLHPQVRACMNEETRPYFDSITAVRESLTASYRVTVRDWNAPGPLFGLPESAFSYPVQPTYELHLDFGSTEFIRYIAAVGGAWYFVFPCPNAAGVALFRESEARAKAQQARIAKLVADLPDALRAELLGILKVERKIDAIHRYQQATGADLADAVQVVTALGRH